MTSCYAASQPEFLSRLTTLLQRLRKYNIKLQLKKFKLGLQEITFVEHTFNKHGTTFSRDKLNGVLAFGKPVYVKKLKQFIGLANYFKDNIRNYSQIMAPLNQQTQGYDKKISQ